MIAASLRRNVWIDRGAYQLYPNQYVILIGLSGAARKSVAMEIGLDLLNEVEDIMILHERMTVEGLIDRIQRVVILPSGKVQPDGSVLIHADELSNLFGKASYITDLMSFLTAGYTSKTKLDFLTRSRNLCSVRNPCISLLAGTTPEQMSEVFPSMALTSGMLGRILIIAGSKGQRVSKPKLDTKMRPLLIHDLKEISKLQGEMVLTPEADKAFDAWYEKINPYPPAELVSFYERKHDHVLKLAMIISISESDNLILTVDHLNSAIEAIEMAESEMPEALAYIGASIQSTLADRIFAVIKSYHPTPVSHSVLLRRVYRKIQSSAEFKDVVETLKDANKITIEASQQGIFYSIKEKKDENKQSNHKNLKKSKNK
jgi:hypothetical protein